MRIAIIAPGSRGDVQPYLALGKGLHDAGYDTRLVTHENFETFVSGHGVSFYPIAGNVQDVAQSADMRALLERGNFVAIMSKMGKEARQNALAFAQAGLAAAQDADLIIAGIGGLFTGIALAEALGLPLLQAYYIPYTPTCAQPSFLFPKLPSWLGSTWINRLSYHLARQVMWQGLRSADRRAREEVLGLQPAPLGGPFNADCLQHTPILYGYSPHVIPKPPDWDDAVHVTGYWFLDPTEEWTPPEALSAFLDDGPPPIYVGFGSMGSRHPEEMVDVILKALAQTQQRGIILSGWGNLHKEDVPDTVFMVDSVPFSWLFPRTAAVVHHGGAGTTSAGLRAGVPSIIVPFFGDQPFWGQRVAALGVGPDPIPRRKLTAERLAQAITQTVTDHTMRRRAADLGAKIEAEDGVTRAVAVITDLMN